MILRPAPRGPWRALHLLSLILVVDLVGAWYKQVASPRYHTVGRASGLLLGAGRSPYQQRRASEEEPGQSPDVAPSLPANWDSSQRQRLQRYPEEAEPWTGLEHPYLGPPGKGRATKRAFPQQASPRSQAAIRNLLALLQRRGLARASRCPAGCLETPWQRPPLHPERAMRKKEQPGAATQESRVFKPAVRSLAE